MSKMQQILWAILIVVILIGIYWWWSSSQMQSVPPPQANGQSAAPFIPATSTATTTGQAAAAPMTATVTYNGTSFSPSSVTLAQGGTVTFTSTAGPMWIASDPHPLHNGYDGTTLQQHCAPGYTGAAPFDQCSAGTSFSFTFDKVGTWGYHDHLNESVGASVTVVAQ